MRLVRTQHGALINAQAITTMWSGDDHQPSGTHTVRVATMDTTTSDVLAGHLTALEADRLLDALCEWLQDDSQTLFDVAAFWQAALEAGVS